jgi:hypothetical protein
MQLYLPPIKGTALADGLSKSEQFTDAESRVVKPEAKRSKDGAGSFIALTKELGKSCEDHRSFITICLSACSSI